MATRTHTNESIDIEAIVRLVVERLRLETANGSIARSAAQQPHLAEPSESAPDTAATNLMIEERVVTTELLRGRLEGIQSLQVMQKAIVTPAVLDDLRDHNIELRRVDASQTPTHNARVRLAILTSPATSSQSAADTLCRLFKTTATVTAQQATGGQLRQCLSQTGAAPVLFITDSPHETLWQVHQLKIRAMLCRTACEIREAKQTFQAKVLLIDSRSGLGSDIVDALRESFSE